MEGVATARHSRLEGCRIFATKKHKKHKGFAHRFVPFVPLCGYEIRLSRQSLRLGQAPEGCGCSKTGTGVPKPANILPFQACQCATTEIGKNIT